MISIKKLLSIFIPAFAIVIIALVVRVIQYEPLVPKVNGVEPGEIVQAPLIPFFPDDPIIGSKRAPITIVAFEDFTCPACRHQNILFDDLLAKYPNRIKIIWKGLPVNNIQNSGELAQNYGFCANEQNKFDAFKKKAFEKQSELNLETLLTISKEINLSERKLESCLNSDRPSNYIQHVQNTAISLNIQSVPTLFLDNKQIKAPTSVNGWESLLGLNSDS